MPYFSGNAMKKCIIFSIQDFVDQKVLIFQSSSGCCEEL